MRFQAGLTLAIASSAALSAPALSQDARRGLDIRAGVDVGYDSNVSRTTAARAAARGVSQEDIHVTPSLGITGTMPLGRHTLEVDAFAGYDFYNKNSRLNRERIAFNGTGAFDLPICDPVVSAGFSRRQSDLGDIIALTAQPGEIDSVKNVETVKSAGLTLACFGSGTVGIRPTASVNYGEGRNSADLRKINDYNSLTYSGGVAYNHPTIGNINAFVRRTETDRPRQDVLLGGDNGFDIMGYGLGFSRQIGSRLSGSVEVSYTDLTPRRAGTPGFKGLSWSADVNALVSERLQVHANFSRSIDNNLAFLSTYYINRQFVVDATYAVTDRISAQIGQTFRNRRFEGAEIVNGESLRTDNQSVTFGSISYKRSDRLRFSLEAGYEKRNSTGDFFDYNNKRVGLGVRYSF